MAVDDQARKERVGRELFPQDVWMARQELRATIPQMRGERCARRRGVTDLFGRGRRVTDGYAHAGRDEVLDEDRRAWNFRRQRHEHDPTASRVLATLEVVEARGDHVGAGMCTAGPILRREIWPFHVKPGNRGTLERGKDARVPGECLERRRDQRRQTSRHTCRPDALQCRQRTLRCEIGSVEVDAAEAVHLEIEESRQLDRHAEA